MENGHRPVWAPADRPPWPSMAFYPSCPAWSRAHLLAATISTLATYLSKLQPPSSSFFLLSVFTAADQLRCSLPPSLSHLWLEQPCQLFCLSPVHLVDPFASANFAQSVRVIASSPSPATEHRQAASRGQPLPELLCFNRSRSHVRGMPLELPGPSILVVVRLSCQSGVCRRPEPPWLSGRVLGKVNLSV
jgi:hypothetical protein